MLQKLEIVENTCPFCNETIYVNKKTFANHVRWCKKNPRYEEIRNSTIEKLSREKVERKEHELTCEICGKKYTIICRDIEFEKQKYKKTCSSECAHKLSVKKTDKSRNLKISKTLRKRYWENKKDCTIKIKNDKYEKECPYCGKIYYTKKLRQIFCSRDCTCKSRHSENVKKSKIKKIYRKQCQFKFALKDYADYFDFSLLYENGWYMAKNHGDNLGGASRDHIISITDGYNNHIDPYLISHPCNCQIMIHNDNIRKYTKSELTVKELKKKIKKFEKIYGKYPNKIDYLGIEDYIKE